ncbi:MAG: glycine cleavage system aminomethyltransferase GcvT [Nitrospirae bacterium]|nr:glycine cleavage system aminomethyltransferase GcvT [Nitrospirota bacterium]
MTAMKDRKRTPLNGWHADAGARMIDFAGWDMPVFYESIIEEHLAVRKQAGLFDISHMGRVEVRGPGARDAISRLVTNNVGKLVPGRALYTLMCDPAGGVVDDVIVYQLAPEEYLICVNAVNRVADVEWMRAHAEGNLEIVDRSDETAQVAIQGPISAEILAAVLGPAVGGLRFFGCLRSPWEGEPLVVARTGYTGEDGFEIYLPAWRLVDLWQKLLLAGRKQGLVPCGLGARDGLRLEMGYPLYGKEISREIGPVEAGLMRFVDLQKEAFIGKDAIRMKAQNSNAQVRGVALKGAGVIRDGCRIMDGGSRAPLGRVTSGGYSPTLKKSIGLALITTQFQGKDLNVEIRDRLVPAHVSSVPFVQPGTRRTGP